MSYFGGPIGTYCRFCLLAEATGYSGLKPACRACDDYLWILVAMGNAQYRTQLERMAHTYQAARGDTVSGHYSRQAA